MYNIEQDNTIIMSWLLSCEFIYTIYMALTFDPTNYISILFFYFLFYFSKRKDFIIWGSLLPMPKSRAIS